MSRRKETAMEKRRVVITGLGAVTPLGHTARETWEAAKAGVCGIAPITLYDHSAQKVSLAGEVKEFDPSGVLEKKEIRRMDRFAQFAVTAAAEAMAHSGLDLEREDRARIGVALSSGIGGIGTLQTSCETGQSRGFDRVSPFFIPMVITNLAAGHIAIRFGLHGMCICPVAACAGGANAVGDAFRHIRDGYAEVMVAGGAEASITPLAMGGFTSMSALTDASDPSRASIPFDKERSGFVMGEGGRGADPGGAGARQGPRGPDPGRDHRLRRHLRRLPHHRPRPGGRLERRLHGAGPGRCRPGPRRRWTTSTPTEPPPPSTTAGRPPPSAGCSAPTRTG